MGSPPGTRRLLFLPIAPGGGRGGEGHSTALEQKLDGLPAMVQAVLSNNPTMQLEVTTQSRKLLSIVVPIFVKLLNPHSEDVYEQAVWALGNVGGDFRKCRDLVLGHGGLFPLLQQLNEHANLSMLRNATWTLSNYCRRKTTKL